MQKQSRIPISDMPQICSLGGGIASTALFLMSLHGEIEYPADIAVFADTGAELEATHKSITQLTEYAKQFDVSVHIVNSPLGAITTAVMDRSYFVDIPFWTTDAKGKRTQLRKMCTDQFKSRPIRRWIRKEFGATFKKPASVWLGYTLNEVHRMKSAPQKYIKRRYPLIEKRIRRDECQRYLEKYGFTETAASACWCCPYRRDNEYVIMTDTEHQKAIDFEVLVNKRGILKGTQNSELRIHKSLIPLSEKPYENTNQLTFDDVDDICDGGSCFT